MTIDEIVCRQFVEVATDYLEGAVPAEDLELVEEHLAMCDWCRDYLHQIESTSAVLAEAAPSAPARRDATGACSERSARSTRGDAPAMIAYKFLCAGGVGPFSRYRVAAARAASARPVGRLAARARCLP